ncbi:hypothetical protein HHUSO_G2632 [Huso huso]|uniref:NACHT domain-containing protein n=1 Tax=Huso huso TaxID=61971 RepID=A0ABR1A7R0_HUSHU
MLNNGVCGGEEMEFILRSQTADANRRKGLHVKLFREHTVGAVVRRCLSVHNKKEYNEVQAFPAIAKGLSTNSQTQEGSCSSCNSSQKLQDLFFAPRICGSQRTVYKLLDLKGAASKTADCHWNVPYKKVSEEADSQIKAHLKHHLHNRHSKRTEYFGGDRAVLRNKEREPPHTFKTEGFLLKDKRLSALLDEERHINFLENPQTFTSLQTEANKLERQMVQSEETSSEHISSSRRTALSGAEVLSESMIKSQDNHGITSDNSNSNTRAVTTSSNPKELADNEDSERDSLMSDSDKINQMLKGDIQMQYSPKKKRFMIYVCGGYSDTVPERNTLMEKVYPQLYDYCKQRGYDFRLVDPRWGVQDGTSNSHTTATLHLEMLRQCKDSEGPNFFLFTGQKRDIHSLPTSILKEDFEAILNVIESKRLEAAKRKRFHLRAKDEAGLRSQSDASVNNTKSISSDLNKNEGSEDASALSNDSSVAHASFSNGDVSSVAQTEKSGLDYEKEIALLQLWYKLDENSIPAIYRLLPISTHNRDFHSKDPLRRQQSKNNWLSASQKLHTILQQNASEAMGEEAACALLRTVLDCEVDQGLQTSGPPEEHCHWFKRTITDIKYNLGSIKASDYIDTHPTQPEINQTLYAAHQKFMDNIHTKLRHTNIYEHNVGWGREGINSKVNSSHLYYTERICNDFKRIVISHFNRSLSSGACKDPPDVRRRDIRQNQVKEEILEHIRHCQTLAGHCIGRESVLTDLSEVVKNSQQKLIVLHGAKGCGKSTLMAKAAVLASNWISGKLKTLVRFVRTTGESRNVRLLLQSLCFQLAEIYHGKANLSEGLHALMNEFIALLEFASEDSPLLIILDGLDELSEEHNTNISWLPPTLPQHVYLIVSTSMESSCLKMLELTIMSNTVHIKPLSPIEVSQMLRCWLEKDHRRLQAGQWRLIVEACLACPSPLYLQSAYQETKQWASFTSPDEIYLPADLCKLYTSILARLEKEHGEQFVKKAVSFITLSRNGITLEELVDLLSQDHSVMQEIQQSHGLTISKFPFVLWARLQHDLGNHLVEQKTDNTYVFNWAHSTLELVCEERYLKTRDAQIALHAEYARYYLGKRTSPDASNANGHGFQPLVWVMEKDSVKNYIFNIRQLHGVAYHLIKSNSISTLVSECLFNYEFLLHKAWGLSVIHLEEDIKAAITPEKQLIDLDVLSEALQLSKKVLLQDPCQLASQLVGRLNQIIATDIPVAPGDPKKFSYLHTLLSQCYISSVPVLVPSFTCLLPPGGLLYDLLAGHTDKITAFTGANKDLIAVTASRDRTLKIWDLASGRAVKTVHEVGRNISSLALCMDNTLVAVTEDHCLQVWEVSSGRMIYSENDSLDIPMLTTAMDGQFLVAFYDGSHTMKVFDLAASCKQLHQVDITPDDNPIHKDRSILVSQNSVKDYVLFAYRSGKEAMVFSARKGEVIAKLPANEPVASVQGVDMTREYFLLICRYPYMRLHEIVHIELFSTGSFQYLRSVKGCCNDPISVLSVTRVGTHVVTFCSSADTNTTEIVTWNLETEDHKHIVKSSSVVTGGACTDLRFCLAVCGKENHIRKWNLASKINDQSLSFNSHKVKSIDGTEEIIPMKNYSSYVVCKSLNPGVVRVWNIVKSKYKGKAVRVERGLYENTDVVIVRDMKLYILTDKGMSAFTETPRPIFQTLLIYDLLKKKYIKKQTGLYIIPCQKHEYQILEGGLLLGLSENRDHMVVWSLETGFIKTRIRPVYKDQLLSNMLQTSLGPKDKHYKELLSKMGNIKEAKAHMTPWERRNETKTAKNRRREKEMKREIEKLQQIDNEKHNGIDQYLISGDEQVLVCSYYAHHLNVFSLESQSHIHMLEDRTSMLFLHNAALNYSGNYLAISNYSDKAKTSYVTLWDTLNGKVRKRLKNEPNVCCVAVTDDASRVVFGVMEANKLKVWDPFKKRHKTIFGYEKLNLGVNSKLHITEGGAKAILLAGDISLWDLKGCTVVSVFTPDSKIQCLSLTHDKETILLGMSDNPALITMKLTSKEIMKTSSKGMDLFGEISSSSDEEEDESGKDPALSA